MACIERNCLDLIFVLFRSIYVYLLVLRLLSYVSIFSKYESSYETELLIFYQTLADRIRYMYVFKLKSRIIHPKPMII